MTIRQGKGPFCFKDTGRKAEFTEKRGNPRFFDEKVKRNEGGYVLPDENER
jgi:hypothetical protein